MPPPHRPRSYDRWEGGTGPWEAKLAIHDLEAAWNANQVYDSVEELAKAMQAQLAVLANSPVAVEQPGVQAALEENMKI